MKIVHFEDNNSKLKQQQQQIRINLFNNLMVLYKYQRIEANTMSYAFDVMTYVKIQLFLSLQKRFTRK